MSTKLHKREMQKIGSVKKIQCLALLLLILTVSCSKDENNSLGDFTINLATVIDTTDTFYLKLDNRQKLWVASPAMAIPDAERVIIRYTTLSSTENGLSKTISLNSIKTVLTKDIQFIDPSDTEEENMIGNDPITILSIWEGGDFINIKFQFNYGEKQQHLVSMIADMPTNDISTSPIKLQFRHNSYSDPELYEVQNYVCFDLRPYKIAAELADKNNLVFEISALDFDNEIKIYTIEYKL